MAATRKKPDKSLRSLFFRKISTAMSGTFRDLASARQILWPTDGGDSFIIRYRDQEFSNSLAIRGVATNKKEKTTLVHLLSWSHHQT
jgi:hypothetical protein